MSYKPWTQYQAAKRIKETSIYNRPWLVLEKLGLTEIPGEVFELTHLEELIVIDNLLTSVPSEVVELPNLSRLIFFYNEIIELPPEIGSITNLTHLDMSCNQLESLPLEIKDLRKLEYLDLRYNSLPIPEEILEKVDEPQLIISAYFENVGLAV